MKKYDEKDTACNKSIFVACERADYVRRHFCAAFQDYRPPKSLRYPRLHEADNTLAARRAQNFRVTLIRLNLTAQQKI